MKKLAVYSVQTGDTLDFAGFGETSRPEGVDYILFTDKGGRESADYQIRVFDDQALDRARSSRLPKLLPHRYLPEYEWSLYIDGNATLISDPLEILSEYHLRNRLLAFRHPDRDCIYDEAEHLIRIGYDSEDRIREQTDHYREKCFPSHNGLIAGTMLLRRHNDADVRDLGEAWFQHVLRFSKRDQLSFNFVAWRQSFQYGTFEGSLRRNTLMKWPRTIRENRVTADFDPNFYAWKYPASVEKGVTPEAHFLQQRAAGLKPTYKRHTWELRSLANAAGSKRGTRAFNANGYADVYESLLSKKKGERFRLLEVVPETSGSEPCLWRSYFRNAEVLRMTLKDALLGGYEGGFDVIVDATGESDKNHRLFEVLFPLLRPAGFYFIEDVQSDLRERLMKLSIRRKPWRDRFRRISIRKNVERIQFFDNSNRTFPTIVTDSLAVIVKSVA